ncbi:MAG: hypothetical protein M1831_003755 [Alyxoria varia]|nr:MAG: hypothetical protein M1831_003755 [Alyxoria varia]
MKRQRHNRLRALQLEHGEPEFAEDVDWNDNKEKATALMKLEYEVSKMGTGAAHPGVKGERYAHATNTLMGRRLSFGVEYSRRFFRTNYEPISQNFTMNTKAKS